MIIILLILSTLGLFIAAVLLKGKRRRWLIGIFAILFLGTIGLLTANDNRHFGLKKVNSTTTQTLVTSVPNKAAHSLNVFLYQPLGSGSEKVYLYRTNISQRKPQATPTKDASATLHQSKDIANATLTVTTTRWRYQNGWMHALFALSDEQNTVANRTYQFRLPTNWLKLSTTQAKQLAKIMEQPSQQRAIKAAVAAKAKTAIMANPNMSATQRSVIQQQAITDAIQTQLKSLK